MCTGGFWSNQRLRFVEHRDAPLKLNNAKVCEASRCGCLLSVENAAGIAGYTQAIASTSVRQTTAHAVVSVLDHSAQSTEKRTSSRLIFPKTGLPHEHVHEFHCHVQCKCNGCASSLATASITPARKQILNVQFNNYYYYQ